MRLNNTHMLSGAAALALALGAPALAQQGGGGSGGSGFDKPLHAHKATQSQNTMSSATVMREDDGDNSYELRIQGDKVSAKVNGKDVPQDRIVREDDQVKILGKDGEVLKTFNVSTGPGAGAVGGGRAGSWSTGGGMGGGPANGAVAQDMPRPKVMVGILMDKANEDQLKSAGLGEDDQAIAVQSVIPGLPAEKAGLQEGDVITEINGEKPATQEKLRDALMQKKPGDSVTFTVQRDGEEKTFRVKLEKYDADKLPTGQTQGMTGMPNDEAVRKLLKNYNVDPGQGFVVPGAPGGRGWAFVTPPGNPQVDERLTDLDKRLNDLDDKLNKLNEQMSKLEKLMDKMSRDKD